MLPALALLSFQRPASEDFDAFVAESAKAVLDVTQGTWSMEIPGQKTRLFVVIDGKRSKLTYVVAGRPYYDLAVTATTMIQVNHADRTYAQTNYPEVKGDAKTEPEPLEPVPPNQFDLRLDTIRGFIFRVNPVATAARTVRKGDVETLVATVKRENGKAADARLTRDAKTKLPVQLRAPTEDEGKPMIVRFKFVRRKIAPSELTIAPEFYKGYREVAPPQNPAR